MLTTLVRFGNKVCFGKLKVILGEFNGFFSIKQIEKQFSFFFLFLITFRLLT